MATNVEKMKELFSDEKLVREVLTIEKAEDAQAWFSDHGVELTLDEVNELGVVLNKIASGEVTEEQLKRAADGEMSEEELTQVAGGLSGTDIAGYIIGGSMGAPYREWQSGLCAFWLLDGKRKPDEDSQTKTQGVP